MKCLYRRGLSNGGMKANLIHFVDSNGVLAICFVDSPVVVQARSDRSRLLQELKTTQLHGAKGTRGVFPSFDTAHAMR